MRHLSGGIFLAFRKELTDSFIGGKTSLILSSGRALWSCNDKATKLISALLEDG